jgi:hypothetical protein
MPKSKHLEQLRAIGLHVTSEIEASRVRELSAASSYAYEEPEEIHLDAPVRAKERETRQDIRFVDEGFRDVDARKVLDRRRIERLLQRSVPQQRPYELAEDAPLRYVEEELDPDEDEEEALGSGGMIRLLNDAFLECRARFGHRRDWLVELESIEDLDATRVLQLQAPGVLRQMLRSAPTPAMLRLLVVNAAERMLAMRSKH